MIRVIDNFLPKEKADELENIILKNPYFPWYLAQSMTFEQDLNRNILRTERQLFYHTFYLKGESNSTATEKMMSIFNLNFESCISIRANLVTPSTVDLRHSRYHCDYNISKFYTGIYYVNGFNTPTILKNKKYKRSVVFPRKGRLLIFDGNIEHAHYMPFFKNRCVINFNFLKNPLVQ